MKHATDSGVDADLYDCQTGGDDSGVWVECRSIEQKARRGIVDVEQQGTLTVDEVPVSRTWKESEFGPVGEL